MISAARAAQPGYFPRWHPGIRAFREWVESEQEIGPQLERLGIRPSDNRRDTAVAAMALLK